MKINKMCAALLVAATLGLASCSDTDAQYTIPEVDAPALVKTTPEAGASQLKAGDITIQVEYDKNIFFATKDLDKISFTGGSLLSADVIGSSKILTLTVNVPGRGTDCTLTIPAGVVTGPNQMPAPEVSLNFRTAALNNTLVAATAAPALKLYNFLLENYETKLLSGMMADGSWNTDMSERVYQWTGKYPAINAFDYGHLAWSVAGRWMDYGDITPVKEWADNNGIVACSWHWNVPKEDPANSVTGTPDLETGYAFYKKDTKFDAAQALIEGTWENKFLVQDLAHVANYLKLLKDAGIPVLWRPLHEAAGGWFWWGKDAASFKAIWIKMFDYFKAQGLDNLIWVWTAETGDEDWYPGDQYVDIIGRDIYSKDAATCASQYASLSATYGDKMVVLSECGSVGLISEQWASGAHWGWFMPWYDGENEDGTPIVHADEAWWKDAMNQDFVISREDLPSME